MNATQTQATPTHATRKTALVAGVLFLVTEVAAIGGKLLQDRALEAGNLDGGAVGPVRAGSLLELVLALACIGTGVALYPILKRHQPGVALGYVAGRLLEAVTIVVGLLSILSITSLSELAASADGTGAGPTAADTLAAVHNWAFQVGPNLILGVNSLLLAYLLYRSRLVPRTIAVLGLVGGSLIIASGTSLVLGVIEMYAPITFVFALPVFAFEVSLAIYLIVKGFRTPTVIPSAAAELADAGVSR
jgi:hypothetical protein